MNANERHVAERLQYIIKDLGYSSSIYDKEGNTISLQSQCVPLAIILPSLFGENAHSKHIPYTFKALPLDRVKYLFKGVQEGDGWLNESKIKGGFTSVSERLVRDVFDIALRFHATGNIKCNYIERPKGNRKYPQGTTIHETVRSYITYNKPAVQKLFNVLYDKNIDISIRKDSRSFIHNELFFVRVKKNEHLLYKEHVYDLNIVDKHYYCANDILVHNTNEVVRRFIMREPGWMQKASGGLPNTMPDWLPDEYLTGDPFTKIPHGELRLPSHGYMTAHDVNMSVPLDTSMFGWNMNEQVGHLTGYRQPLTDTEKYTRSAHSIKDIMAQQLSTATDAAKTDMNYFNPRLNLSGTADIVRRIGGSTQMINVKVVGPDTFGDLSARMQKDEAELNAVLNIANQSHGNVMYVNAQTGETKSVGVKANRSKFMRDLQVTQSARNISLNILQSGPRASANPANTFSRVDRLSILADVAPNSREFFNTQRQVEQLASLGMLDENDIMKFQSAIKKRQIVQQGYTFEKNKFLSSFQTAATPEARSEQMALRNQYSLAERSIGAGWEYLTNVVNTPLHNKFMGTTTALEKYKRNRVYGREVKMWNHPIDHFVEPYKDTLLGNEDFTTGVMQGALPGIFLGPTYAVAGGAVGAVAAGVNIAAGGSTPPGHRQKEWDIVQSMDQLEYEKYKALYQATGSAAALNKMERTMAYTIENPGSTVSEQVSTLPRPDRPYFAALARANTVEERAQILNTVPEYMAKMLRQRWDIQNTGLNPQGEMINRENPKQMQGVDPWLLSQNMPDLAMKVMDQHGVDAHDAGLGFYSQRRRLERFETGRVESGIESSYGFDMRSMLGGITGSNSISIMNNSSQSTNVELIVEE